MLEDISLGDIIFSAEEIRLRIKELARKIAEDFSPNEVSMLILYEGAGTFAAILGQELAAHPVWVRSFPALVKSYTGRASREVDLIIPGAEDLPRKILVVEDILDSGKTLKTLGDFLENHTSVREVSICTLLHKGKVPDYELHIEYVGFHCPDEFVVGFGLDYDGLFRNLPFIAKLNVHENG